MRLTFGLRLQRTCQITWKEGNAKGDGSSCYAYELRVTMALATFVIPTVAVECSVCRWRLDSSTTSPSTSPTVPTPAPTRYEAAGHPKPPTPTISTDALLSLSWPVKPSVTRSSRSGCRSTLQAYFRHDELAPISLVLIPLQRPSLTGFPLLLRGHRQRIFRLGLQVAWVPLRLLSLMEQFCIGELSTEIFQFRFTCRNLLTQ